MDLGVVALLVLFLAAFFLTPTVWSMYVGDPLPQSVRTRFNKMAHIGKKAEAGMQIVRASNQQRTKNIEARYTTIATRFNAVIDRAIEGIKLNRVDASFLSNELDKLLNMAREFDVDIDRMTNVSYPTVKEVQGYVDTVVGLADTSMKDWRRLASKKEELQRITIRQLQDMRWLSWGAKRSGYDIQQRRLAASAWDDRLSHLATRQEAQSAPSKTLHL